MGGRVISGTTGVAITTLPEEWRPPRDVGGTGRVWATNAPQRWHVSAATGVVSITTGYDGTNIASVLDRMRWSPARPLVI